MVFYCYEHLRSRIYRVMLLVQKKVDDNSLTGKFED